VHTVFCPDCIHIFAVDDLDGETTCPECARSFVPRWGVTQRGKYTWPHCGQVERVLEPLLAHMQDRETARFLLRRLFADGSDWLMQRSPSIVIFLVARITLNREPHLIHDGRELRFAHVFGRGLRQEDVGYFAAPFALS